MYPQQTVYLIRLFDGARCEPPVSSRSQGVRGGQVGLRLILGGNTGRPERISESCAAGELTAGRSGVIGQPWKAAESLCYQLMYQMVSPGSSSKTQKTLARVACVKYPGLYSGIDLVFNGDNEQLGTISSYPRCQRRFDSDAHHGGQAGVERAGRRQHQNSRDPVPRLSDLSPFGSYRVASALASITADLRAAAS